VIDNVVNRRGHEPWWHLLRAEVTGSLQMSNFAIADDSLNDGNSVSQNPFASQPSGSR
jgi:hypothetical protein